MQFYSKKSWELWIIIMIKSNEDSYHCRVCGFKQDFQPWGEDRAFPPKRFDR
jgi:hypothetical protein